MTNSIMPDLELRYKIAKFIENAYTKLKHWVLPMLLILIIVTPVFA